MQPTDNGLNITTAGDVTHELLKQNQIIDEEINRYDKMLDSWPMIFYRIWIFTFVAALSAGILAILYHVPSILAQTDNFKYVEVLFLFVGIAILGLLINGCVQMRMGLYSRDMTKVDKAIVTFETAAKYCSYSSIYSFIRCLFTANIPLSISLVCLIPMTVSLINLLPAYYAKGVLEKRNVFQRVSSSPENAI